MLRATMKIPSSLALECTLKKVPATLADSPLRKPISVSAANTKRFIINDHYEFDQKVSRKCHFKQNEIKNETNKHAPYLE